MVDLDTVMGGYLMYDFGDLVRTVACSLPETATDWGQIQVIPELVEELLSGYLEGLNAANTPLELESLLLGGEIMTLIMGLRFLTDHLEGNVYYRVSYPFKTFTALKINWPCSRVNTNIEFASPTLLHHFKNGNLKK